MVLIVDVHRVGPAIATVVLDSVDHIIICWCGYTWERRTRRQVLEPDLVQQATVFAACSTGLAEGVALVAYAGPERTLRITAMCNAKCRLKIGNFILRQPEPSSEWPAQTELELSIVEEPLSPALGCGWLIG